MTDTAVPLREYNEAILTEKDRAVSMADDEREKAASALRSEQQRREDQATAERDKAAENLRIELARAIKEGDERLREHILNQIMQIKDALVSADKLEIERLAKLAAVIQGEAMKLEVLRGSQTEAQTKFETSVASRFTQVNEFRGSLDDLSKQMATRRELETMQKAQYDANQEIAKQLGDLRSRLDVGPVGLGTLQRGFDAFSGQREGRSEQTKEAQARTSTTTAVMGVAIAMVLIVLAILNFTALHNASPATPPSVTVTQP